ncbi:MAG: alpha/beta hydrolase [Pontixanthobacter sp.]
MALETSWDPPVDSGIGIEFVEANGLRFEVAMMDAVGTDANDRLALCLHGFPELHYSWRHQMPVLADMGYRVWAPNMRGYGRTSRPEGVAQYGLDDLAQDVAALIDASGARETVLIAHDWGAIVAWHFAIRKLRPLARLVIMNVPHPKCGQREIRKWRQMRKSWYIAFFQIPWLPEKLLGRRDAAPIVDVFRGSAVHKARFTDAALAPYRTAAAQPGALTAMLNYYRALVRLSDAKGIGDGMVDVPTLVLWGEQDVAIDIHCLDGMEDYVPGLTVERFADASHWVQQDVPDEVNAALREWLAR